jgi:putative transposase
VGQSWALSFARAFWTEAVSAIRQESLRHVLLLSSAAVVHEYGCELHTFEAALERVRRNYGLYVYGYVVMPEHVHLLLSEPARGILAEALKSLKQGMSRRLIGDAEHFWQKRYYDHNVRTAQSFRNKLRYMHRNPVKRGLVARPEDWPWSSFRHYLTGCAGVVEIESEWTAYRREREAGRMCPQIPLPHSSQKRA